MTGPTDRRAVGTHGLVFGGSSGIGAAVATEMAGRGCHVVAASRRATAPSPAVASTVTCDVRVPDQVERAVRTAHRGTGLAWVVNAAGVGYFAPVDGDYAERWRDIVEVNVLGLLALLAALRTLTPPIEHLVHIGSLAAYRPSETPGNDVYAATKAAGASLIRDHRRALRAEGVYTKITLITPGFVGGTDFGRNFFAHAPDQRRPILDRFPPLTPTDVAAAIVHVLDQPPNVELTEVVIRSVHQID